MSSQIAAATKRRRWEASLDAEATRLSVKESDWNLPGTSNTPALGRTRGKCIVLSPLLSLPINAKLNCCWSDEASDGEDEEVADEEEQEPQFEPVVVTAEEDSKNFEVPPAVETTKSTKPANTRVIVEVKALVNLLEENLKPCPKCGSKLRVEMKNVCLATSVRLVCVNDKHCCHIIYGQPPAPAQVPLAAGKSPLKTRMTDFAINVLFVLSHLASGDGGTEASLLLGHLGLPNSTTMSTRSFSIIEAQLHPALRKIMEEVVQTNIEDKVRAQFMLDGKTEEDFKNWKDQEGDTPTYAKVKAGTDMGWQGRKQSLSGHAFFAGSPQERLLLGSYFHSTVAFARVPSPVLPFASTVLFAPRIGMDRPRRWSPMQFCRCI